MSSSSYADSSSEAALAEKRREVFVRNLPFDATAEVNDDYVFYVFCNVHNS